MKKFLSVVMAAATLLSIMILPAYPADEKLPFEDVTDEKWYYECVDTMYRNEINGVKLMQGITPTIFAPESSMTRAELVTLLSRIAGADVTGMESKASELIDIERNSWYADYVGWAVDCGVVKGYDDKTFRPNNPISRQEIAVLTVRFLKMIDLDILAENPIDKFKDQEDVAEWAAGDVEVLRTTGLIEGDDNGYFNPVKTATRAEISMIMSRLLVHLYRKDIKADGTEFTYEFKEFTASEKEFTEWISSLADANDAFAECSVTNFADVSAFAGQVIAGDSGKHGIEISFNNFGVKTTAKYVVNFVRESDLSHLVKPANTELLFDYSISVSDENGFNLWIKELTDPDNAMDSASVDFSAVRMFLKDVAPGSASESNIKVRFKKDAGSFTVEYVLKASKPKVFDSNAPTSENIGVQYSQENGATISNTVILNDGERNITANGTGTHGGHESKVLRTDFGTYSTYVTGSYVEYGYTYSGTLSEPDISQMIAGKRGATSAKINDYGKVADADSALSNGNDVVIKVNITFTSGGSTFVENCSIHLFKGSSFPAYSMDMDQFKIMKIIPEGVEVLGSYEYPHSNGSCVPNIFAGEYGTIYVSVISVDNPKYYEHNHTQGAYLQIYEIDEAKKTIDVYNGRPDFKIWRSGNYGYSQPIPDIKNGKIYALYTGEGIPGCLAWFVYDIKNHSWDNTCHAVETDYRLAYFNAYADGKGGFYFLGQRDVLVKDLIAKLDLEGILRSTTGYAWDALYIYSIPDVNKDEFKISSTVYEPDYRAIWESKNKPKNGTSAVGATHYGCGCTYLDSKGRLHIIWLKGETKKMMYTVYDTSGWQKTYESDFSLTNASDYSFAMSEGKDGELYIIGYWCKSTIRSANLEIWKIEDDFSITKSVDTVKLTTASGDEINNTSSSVSTKLIMTSPRNGSLKDGTVGIIYYTSVRDGTSNYNYVSVELP